MFTCLEFNKAALVSFQRIKSFLLWTDNTISSLSNTTNMFSLLETKKKKKHFTTNHGQGIVEDWPMKFYWIFNFDKEY